MKNVGYVNRSAGEIAEIYGLPRRVFVKEEIDFRLEPGALAKFRDRRFGEFGRFLEQILGLGDEDERRDFKIDKF